MHATRGGTGEVYLDSNVVFYSASADRVFGPSCSVILQDIQEGRLRAAASILIVPEVANTMFRSGRAKGMDRVTAAMTSLPLRFHDVTEPVVLEGVRLSRLASASPYDGIHAATMQVLGISVILSADTDFDRFAGITRLDPRVYTASHDPT
ncbi:MAG TPA: type II toxin-antitoxin system VapC family toxin [Thermoplasmata archaeon]|nr:type II toxin-antitoxin system VapC family toxin [Thermoplasmata archaeon]